MNTRRHPTPFSRILLTFAALGTVAALMVVAPAVASADQPRWEVGDKVEALWGKRWWSGEIIDTRADLFKVHYTGWDKSWDEWMEAPRLRAPRSLRINECRRGDKVQIFWKHTWYPGTILKVKGKRAFIHYTGYGPKWDEWVGPTRLRWPDDR